MQIHDAGTLAKDLSQLAEVGCKPDVSAGGDERFADCEGERHAVARGGAAAELVHDDEGGGGDVFEDEGGFAHFRGKGGDVGFDGVVEGDAGKELVREGEGGVLGRDALGIRFGIDEKGWRRRYKEPI